MIMIIALYVATYIPAIWQFRSTIHTAIMQDRFTFQYLAYLLHLKARLQVIYNYCNHPIMHCGISRVELQLLSLLVIRKCKGDH